MKLWLFNKNIPDSFTVDFGNTTRTYSAEEYEDIKNNGISFTESDLKDNNFSNITVSTTINNVTDIETFKNGISYTTGVSEGSENSIINITTDDLQDIPVVSEVPFGEQDESENGKYVICDGKLYKCFKSDTSYFLYNSSFGNAISTSYNNVSYYVLYSYGEPTDVDSYIKLNKKFDKVYICYRDRNYNEIYREVPGSFITTRFVTVAQSDGSYLHRVIFSGYLPDGTILVFGTNYTVVDGNIVSPQTNSQTKSVYNLGYGYSQVPLVSMKDFLNIDYSDKYYNIEGTIYHAYKKELSLVSWCDGIFYTDGDKPAVEDPLYDCEGNIISYISEIYTDSETNKVYIKLASTYMNFISGCQDTDSKVSEISVNMLEATGNNIETPVKYYCYAYNGGCNTKFFTIYNDPFKISEAFKAAYWNNSGVLWYQQLYLKTDDGFYLSTSDTIFNKMMNDDFGKDGYYKLYAYNKETSSYTYMNIDIYPVICIY